MTNKRELAVVTGASRGIGRSTAKAFAKRGLDVALLGRQSPDLEESLNQVSEFGVRAVAIPCDVSEEAQIKDACALILDELGTPRVVVNNAGIVQRGAKVHETALADWDLVMKVNLRAPFLFARAFLPSMLKEKKGRLVQIASISATLGSPGAASYAASKWGVVGLTKSLAEELRGTGLQAVAILPGSVDTDMLKGSGFEPKMTPDDVANLVVYASLDAPDAMTSSAIEIFG